MVFAIVIQNGLDEFPGRLVAVPFSALTISGAKSQEIRVVLKVDKEKFYNAPSLTPNIWITPNGRQDCTDILGSTLIGQKKKLDRQLQTRRKIIITLFTPKKEKGSHPGREMVYSLRID